MPPKSQNTIHILEGKATLYQRPTTPIWFVRYKADGKWLRTTTKCEALPAEFFAQLKEEFNHD